MNIAELQAEGRAEVFGPVVFSSAPLPARELWLYPDDGGRRILRTQTVSEGAHLDAIVAAGARWFAEHRPDRLSSRAWNEMHTYVCDQVYRPEGSIVCGFDPLTAALLSWLIQQGLSWLWRWLHQQHNATELICGMTLS